MLKKPPKPKTEHQREYLRSLHHNKITFCDGPAGTGKTFLSTLTGILGLMEGKYHKIIISRPLVQSGEDTGYLPGGINDKLDPYMQPIQDVLEHFLSPNVLEDYRQNKQIEIVPFAYMRGRNFFKSYIILDEVQNCSYPQLLLALTRFAKGSTMVLTGDLNQSDLPESKQGAMKTIMDKLQDTKDIGIIKLDNSDIIREPIVKTILEKLNGTSETPG